MKREIVSQMFSNFDRLVKKRTNEIRHLLSGKKRKSFVKVLEKPSMQEKNCFPFFCQHFVVRLRFSFQSHFFPLVSCKIVKGRRKFVVLSDI